MNFAAKSIEAIRQIAGLVAGAGYVAPHESAVRDYSLVHLIW